MSAHVPVTAERPPCRVCDRPRTDHGGEDDGIHEDGIEICDGYEPDPAREPVTAEELAEIAAAEVVTRILPASRALDLMKRLARDLAERATERDEWKAQAGANAHGCQEQKTFREAAEAERDEARAEVERLIREAGAIRNDERQRAEAEHKALADEGRQRDANRIERLEGEIARLRVIVDDADRAKAEHEKTRDELRRLHDVLSGAKKL